ncbi:RNA polymerase sporulation sigma factor SigF [Lutispora saccharofermentans]|uniref:RNA polymerase sigma factor n=1 Tax=Lutispora saccharofermentans TaxID=3024236 RepID=A0ABT1NI89_9FIRM|nr:RNA polymerase sporulation sigma factor SigF [Lutispora saccharofermentans]MCQ1530997.1 RNA polymerase sporulation sigma factor SigF [Lutispora saccharofermentans]
MDWSELSQEAIIDIILKAQSGDTNAENYIVSQNLGLVRSVVKRFLNRGCEYEDLVQIGSIGLLKAIKKFDSSYNVRFSTYAIPMIIGEIKRFLRDDGLIKVSRSIKEIAIKANACKENIEKNFGREPTVSELAAELDIPAEDLIIAMDSINSTQSLQEVIYQDDGSPVLLIDKIQNESLEDIDLIDKIALREVLATLEPRERQIIMLRYFSENTQCQVANILGISQVQVSRIEKKILDKLRKRIT